MDATNPVSEQPPRTKGVFIGAPACFALELAIRPVCAAFRAYHGTCGCYVVGSALERQDWRDVDVRLIMEDVAFLAEFPDAHSVDHYEQDARWLLFTTVISAHLSTLTGLPIDFQIQPQSIANKRHDKRRNAIGIVLRKDVSHD